MLNRYVNGIIDVNIRPNLTIAARSIMSMHGGSRSRLVLDEYGHPWILKFCINPQHEYVVLNECLGTYIAQRVGLTVPPFSLMSLHMLEEAKLSLACEEPGENFDKFHFASSFVGYSPFGKTVDTLACCNSQTVSNFREFGGVLALDIWLRNTDRRQAVFLQKGRHRKYTAYWIDFGSCFGGGDAPGSGHRQVDTVRGCMCYKHIRSLSDFDPWLSNIEWLPIADVKRFIKSLPQKLLRGYEKRLEEILLWLSAGQKTVRSDLWNYVSASPNVFVGCTKLPSPEPYRHFGR